MTAILTDYEEFIKKLGTAPRIDEQRAQALALEVVSGLRGEDRDLILAVLVELLYGMMPAPGEGAEQAERDRYSRHLAIVKAIARLAEQEGEEFEGRRRMGSIGRTERAEALAGADGPLSSAASERSDDVLNIAKLKAGEYRPQDFERALAPIIHDLANSQRLMKVNRAEQLMKLLYLVENSGRENLLLMCEVAQAHAYSFTKECKKQRAAYIRKLATEAFTGSEEMKPEVDDSKWEEGEREPYNRLKSQERIMAQLMIDTTPDEVIVTVREVLGVLLEGHTQPGQVAVEG